MNSAMLCFLFLVILVNDICIFAKLVLVQIQNSFCCHHGKSTAASKKPGKEKVKSKVKHHWHPPQAEPLKVGQKFPNSSLP